MGQKQLCEERLAANFAKLANDINCRDMDILEALPLLSNINTKKTIPRYITVKLLKTTVCKTRLITFKEQ